MMRRFALAATLLLCATAAAAEGPRNAALVPTPALRTEVPRPGADGVLACPDHLPALSAFVLKSGRRALLCTAPGDVRALASVHPGVPRGWRNAWDDGRLNPLRGAPTTH